MLSSLFDAEQRSKRQLVKYDEIPKVVVEAVTSIEDRRFFQHNGVNFMRLVEAAWIDFTHQRHQQGGSTITMQLSRAFFLSPEKTFRRKLIEMLIAVELEQKFSKQQIFEFYANRVDLGQRGSFTISGLAEGSRSYFNLSLIHIFSAKSVGFDDLRARLQIVVVDRANQLRLRKVQLVIAAVDENPLGIEQRPHGPIAEHRRLFQTFNQVLRHLFENTRSGELVPRRRAFSWLFLRVPSCPWWLRDSNFFLCYNPCSCIQVIIRHEVGVPSLEKSLKKPLLILLLLLPACLTLLSCGGASAPASHTSGIAYRAFVTNNVSAGTASAGILSLIHICRASPARMAMASPNALWQVGRPRRRSSLSSAGRSSWIKE